MKDKKVTLHSLRFGSETIHYNVSYRKRRTLAINVHPDLQVEVFAPLGTTLELIREKVRKRAGWIIRQKTYFAKFLPHIPKKKYVSGESFRYLGKQYRLKIKKSKNEAVLIKNGYLTVYLPDSERKKQIIKLLDTWYRERAIEQFSKRSEKLLHAFNGNRPSIRDTKTQRGKES